MKVSNSLLGLWIAIVLVVGSLGDYLLARHWQDQQEASFKQSAFSAVANLSGFTDEPLLESSEAWREIETASQLQIVPSPATAGSDESVQSTWLKSGDLRISLLIPLDRFAGIESIRVTREQPGPTYRRWWWAIWLSTLSIGVGIVYWTVHDSQRALKLNKSAIDIWTTASSLKNFKAVGLPKIAEIDASLEPALSGIGDRINVALSELYELNRRSELVFGNLMEGVLAIDDHTHVLLANKSVRQLLSIDDPNYLNRPLLEIVRYPAIAQLIHYVLKNKASKESALEIGSPVRNLRLSALPLSLSSDRTGALVTVRDETQLRRIEAVRRDFVANASHELKTPLAAIRAYAETLQLGAIDDNEVADKFLNDIVAQADRIDALVKGMLHLSRAQSGFGLRYEDFEVQEALAACIAANTAVARGKNVQVLTDFPASRILIHSDREGYQTIVSNLLSNAVRYTPAGGQVTVRIAVENGWCILSVADTGVGIAPVDLERIFERFYRAEKDRSVETGGTGLGLSIVKHLVNALGGTIHVESELEKGSRFEVRLPQQR